MRRSEASTLSIQPAYSRPRAPTSRLPLGAKSRPRRWATSVIAAARNARGVTAARPGGLALFNARIRGAGS
jgi:hypothetical protein